MKIKEFLLSHFDFNCYIVTIIAAITAILIVPCERFLPYRCGYENGLLENIQMFFLFLGCFYALKAPKEKKFFRFVFLVLSILILREINCGRTMFFQIPGYDNAFYSWSDIKYGWLANPLFCIYIAGVGIYFLWNKLYLKLWDFLSKTKLPIWNIIFMVFGIIWGLYSESKLHDDMFEELTELLFYVSMVGIVYLYSHHKNFQLEDKK